MTEKTQRLMSLDTLRGFDMLWIIGGERVIHAWAKTTDNTAVHSLSSQFHHPVWNGFSFYDLIFPLFIFMAGMSMPYAITSKLEKGEDKKVIVKRLLKRLLLLILFGAIYNGLLGFQENQRFASVLARIAISTFIAGLIVTYFDIKRQASVLIGILLGYWLALELFSAPGFATGELSIFGNFCSYVDSILLPGRLHKGIHDPEGLLTNVSATATALFGVLSGHYIRSSKSEASKFKTLICSGIGLLLLGWIWNIVLPVNKNLWTSSFVLVTAGWSNILFATFYLIIDVKKYQKWSMPFQWIGVNSILIYMLAGGGIIDFEKISQYFFLGFSKWLIPTYSSILIPFMAIIIELLLLRYLYNNKTFLKV
ncbi:MAG: DUF5009 domain-containing protein [Lentisphaeraceae bacterium]|nr:DUF5009 domain-containing protein [Lentisphaeraceae bacterium]